MVLAAQRVVNAASAVQAVGLAGIAARDEVRAGDGSWVAVDRGAGFVGEFAAVSVAPMLGLTSRGAEERVRTAAGLVSRLPGVLAAMGAGELDAWRASIVVAETAETTPEACARVEGMVLPRICAESGGRVRARVRRALARVDADAVRVRAAKARLERSVRVFPSPRGGAVGVGGGAAGARVGAVQGGGRGPRCRVAGARTRTCPRTRPGPTRWWTWSWPGSR